MERKTKEKNIHYKAIQKGLMAGTLVCVLGYGILRIMYHVWSSANSEIALKGMFDYYASRYGDLFCLPAFVGFTVTYLNWHQNEKKTIDYKLKMEHIVGILFAFVGLAIQISWLISDDTKPNWSIPAVHYFNYAGWYHAAFFVCYLFLTGYLITKLVISKKNMPIVSETIDKILLQAGIWYSLSQFMFLNIIDDYIDSSNGFYVLSVTLVVIIILFILCVFIGYLGRLQYNKLSSSSKMKVGVKESLIIEIETIIASVVTAYAIANILISKGENAVSWILVISSLFLVVMLLNPNNTLQKNIKVYFITVIPMFALEIALSLTDKVVQSATMLILAIFVPVITSNVQYKNRRNNDDDKFITNAEWCITGIIFSICILIIAVIYPQFWIIAKDIGILNFMFVFCIKNYITGSFEYIKKAESKDDRNADEVKEIKKKYYSMYAIIFVGTILLFIYVLWEKISLFDIEIYSVRQLLISVMLFVFFSILIMLLRNVIQSTARFVILILLTIGLYAVCTISILSFININIVDYRNIYWLLVPLIAGSLLIGIGFYNNVILIRGMKANSMVSICSFIIFGGVLFNTAACTLLFSDYSSMLGLLIYMVSIFVCTIGIPMMIYEALGLHYPDERMLVNLPSEGICQDGFMFGILLLMVICVDAKLVNSILNIIQIGSEDITVQMVEAVKLVVNVLVIVYLLNWFLKFCLDNNINHYKEEKKQAKRRFQDELIGLRKHLTFQNIMTICSTFPFSLAIIIGWFYKSTIESGKVVDNFVAKVIPVDLNEE